VKELGKRIWYEPAAAIGLLASIILLVINLVGDNDWNVEHIIAIVAPLASALGIRQLVTPVGKVEEMLENVTPAPVVAPAATATPPPVNPATKLPSSTDPPKG
jgi:hypothetical protein